jgi:hypothetical protein
LVLSLLFFFFSSLSVFFWAGWFLKSLLHLILGFLSVDFLSYLS